MTRAVPSSSGVDLRVFRDPGSVVVVGASADPVKWGYWLAEGALAGRHRRHVYLVNRSGAEILGQVSYRSLGDLPAAAELVALCVPPADVGAVVDEALGLGARGFLGVTAGVPGEDAIARRIADAGGRLVGMNSLGIYDSSTDLRLAWGEFTPGPIAVISQSGQLGSEIAILAARAGLGVSRFVSVGNQSDVCAGELLDDLSADDATRVVALYLESFASGEPLIQTLTRLREAGKHTVLLTVGGSEASTRLARSHTGSLTSSLDVVDAAARVAGVIRVNTPSELVDVARLLLTSVMPAGNRVAIVGDSGGQTGIAADVAAAATLRVPSFSDALRNELARLLPDGAACSNPVDLAGAGEKDLVSYTEVVSALLASHEVDSVLLTGYLGSYGMSTPSVAGRELEIVEAMGAAVSAAAKPLLVHTMAEDNPATEAMWSHAIPAYLTIESAIRALVDAERLARAGRPLRIPVPCTDPVGGGYLAAQRVLAQAGIRFPAAVVVRERADLATANDRLTAPYVLKASWLEHKSEVGGVRVGLADLDSLTEAFDVMHASLGPGDYVVEELDARRHTVEILVGARRDPDLGPIVVVGAGGTEAEVYRDVTAEMAPVDTVTARNMLGRLACAPLLRGWRGRPAVAVDALADAVVAVSEVAASRPRISEIDVNPLRVGPDGVLAVDALIIEKG